LVKHAAGSLAALLPALALVAAARLASWLGLVLASLCDEVGVRALHREAELGNKVGC
jgi:hypothetical protein